MKRALALGVLLATITLALTGCSLSFKSRRTDLYLRELFTHLGPTIDAMKRIDAAETDDERAAAAQASVAVFADVRKNIAYMDARNVYPEAVGLGAFFEQWAQDCGKLFAASARALARAAADDDDARLESTLDALGLEFDALHERFKTVPKKIARELKARHRYTSLDLNVFLRGLE